MISFFLLFPIYITVLYLVWLLVKQPNRDDRYFHDFYETGLLNILGKISLLSMDRGRNYDREKRYAKKLHEQAEDTGFGESRKTVLEQFLIDIYSMILKAGGLLLRRQIFCIR